MATRYNYNFNKSKHVILFIFDYKCTLCGAISVSNHVHHIDGNFNNNCAFNFAILCKTCHIMTHKLHLTIKIDYTDIQLVMLKKLNNIL